MWYHSGITGSNGGEEMIVETYYIYDASLNYLEHYDRRGDAEVQAQAYAQGNGEPYGVFLRVPVGGSDVNELRAVTVFDNVGNEVFHTEAYDSELVAG